VYEARACLDASRFRDIQWHSVRCRAKLAFSFIQVGNTVQIPSGTLVFFAFAGSCRVNLD